MIHKLWWSPQLPPCPHCNHHFPHPPLPSHPCVYDGGYPPVLACHEHYCQARPHPRHAIVMHPDTSSVNMISHKYRKRSMSKHQEVKKTCIFTPQQNKHESPSSTPSTYPAPLVLQRLFILLDVCPCGPLASHWLLPKMDNLQKVLHLSAA